jgi:hypothetical protein
MRLSGREISSSSMLPREEGIDMEEARMELPVRVLGLLVAELIDDGIVDAFANVVSIGFAAAVLLGAAAVLSLGVVVAAFIVIYRLRMMLAF